VTLFSPPQLHPSHDAPPSRTASVPRLALPAARSLALTLNEPFELPVLIGSEISVLYSNWDVFIIQSDSTGIFSDFFYTPLAFRSIVAERLGIIRLFELHVD
jgi:hypothetical protein